MSHTDEDPANNLDNYKLGIFYYNPDDDRVLIRVSGTVNRYIFNYARWVVYIIIIPAFLLIIYAIIDAMLLRK